MADPSGAGVWAHRALYLGLAGGLLFLRMLPLGSAAGGWPGPDLLLCLTLCWALRRPDYVPVALVALVVLLEDLLLMRPPGLWAAFVVLSAEFLRRRAVAAREMGFLLEWLMVAGVILAATVGCRLILALVMLPQPGPAETLIQAAVTILCYPLVVGASRLALGMRKPATGEVDAYGRRL
jgi:rod shape-determining protein MreD